VSVSEWVNYLTGEDFRTIKQLGVLPSAMRDPVALLGADAPTATPVWITPYWWAEQGMAAEFYDFLRAFWHREIACHRPESGGQWDREAHRLIWTVKIAAEDAALFESHRAVFEMLADRFFGATPRGEAPPQIYYIEIIAAIGPLATTLEQTDLIRLIQIIHKMRTMLYNLRFAHVALSELRFAPIRHTPPQESRCQLIEAWRVYTNGHRLTDPQPSLEELNAIYRVGLCRALSEGRSGVLAQLPGEREWSRCRDFLAQFRARIAALMESTKSQPVLCRVQAEVVEGVSAAADMLIGETAWFFVGGDVPTELQRLERMVGVLLTVHALRQAGHRVSRVCLFQMITGLSLEWSVAEWMGTSSALLTAFIQARVQHTAAATSGGGSGSSA
jgi:hypothetical protein